MGCSPQLTPVESSRNPHHVRAPAPRFTIHHRGWIPHGEEAGFSFPQPWNTLCRGSPAARLKPGCPRANRVIRSSRGRVNGCRASPCGGVSAGLLPRSESSAKARKDAAGDWRADSYSARHARAPCQCFFQQPGTRNSAGRKLPAQKPPSAERKRCSHKPDTKNVGQGTPPDRWAFGTAGRNRDRAGDTSSLAGSSVDPR